MGKSSGEQSTTTVQKADPWEGVQPALRELYSSALSNFQGPGPQYYPNSTVAPQSPTTSLYQDLLFGRALSGNPLTGQAQEQAYSTLGDDYMFNPATLGMLGMAGQDFLSSSPGMQQLQDVAGGSMLNQNPYLDDMFNRASSAVGRQFSNNVMPGIASMFSGAGRFGSNQMAEGLGQAEQQYGDTLNRLATDIYGGNYAQERGYQQQALGQLGQFGLAGRGLQQQALSDMGTQLGRERAFQMQALGMTPQLAQQDYFDLGQLGQLGQSLDAYNQQLLGADINRYNYYQNLPNQELQFLNSILNSGINLSGSTGTTTQPSQGSSPLMGALGGASIGQALFAGNPWGMGIGALLGLF